MPDKRTSIHPDLSRPILYTDPQTGEQIPGNGSTAPEAHGPREELQRKLKKRMQNRYKRGGVSRAENPAAAWSDEERAARCNVGPEDAPAAIDEASPELRTINTTLPNKP